MVKKKTKKVKMTKQWTIGMSSLMIWLQLHEQSKTSFLVDIGASKKNDGIR